MAPCWRWWWLTLVTLPSEWHSILLTVHNWFLHSSVEGPLCCPILCDVIHLDCLEQNHLVPGTPFQESHGLCFLERNCWDLGQAPSLPHPAHWFPMLLYWQCSNSQRWLTVLCPSHLSYFCHSHQQWVDSGRLGRNSPHPFSPPNYLLCDLSVWFLIRTHSFFSL